MGVPTLTRDGWHDATPEVDQPAKVTITPAMQREKASTKRAKGRRGPGKCRSKLRKKRSMKSKASAESLSTEGRKRKSAAKKKASKRRVRAKVATTDAEMPIEPFEEPDAIEPEEATAIEPMAEAEQEPEAMEAMDDPSAIENAPEEPAAVEAKAEAPKRRGRKAKVPEGESAEHAQQRRVWMSETRWVYEVIAGQRYGCPNCRFLFFGCKSCKRDGFRGKTAAKQLLDPDYIRALGVLCGDRASGSEIKAAPKKCGKGNRGKPSGSGDQ